MPSALAGLLIALGTGLLTVVGPHTAVWYLILAYLLFGVGAGLVTAPITNTALAGMPRDQSGELAGAIASTCRQTGAAFGVAICGPIVAASSSGFARPATPRGRSWPAAASRPWRSD